MKFRTKLALSITCLFIIALSIIIVLVYRTFLHVSIESEKSILIDRGFAIAEKHKTMPESEWLESLSVNVPDDGFIRLVDDDEQVLYMQQDPGSKLDPERIRADDAEHPETRLYSADGTKVLVVRVPLSRKHETAIEIVEPLTALDRSIHDLLWISIGTSAGATVVIFLLSGLFARLLLRPISRLVRTMREIETNLSFQKVPSKGSVKDELFQLTSTFNRMIERIRENHLRQQQFVSDASHELRTPLTILEGYANMLRRWGHADPEQGKKATEVIYQETVRMRNMTEQLLDLASSENQAAVTLEPVELVTLCEEAAELFRGSHGRTINVLPSSADIRLRLDGMRIKQLLFILLDNALKYSQRAVDILVSRVTDSAEVHLIVRDRGIGIAKEEIEHVFERFYRIDPSRQRASGGTGLGLSIARNIVLLHGGKIEIRSREREGTDVIVRLPDRL